MAALVVSIDGTTVTPDRGSLTIEQTLGARHLCSLEWSDPDGSGLHPELGDELVVTNSSGGTEFGGLVGSVRERGLTRASLVALTRSVTAYDYAGYCDQRVVTGSWSSASLKTILEDLTSDYLSTFGVTVSPAQDEGTTGLGALSYDYRTLTDVLNDLATRSGWAWRLDYDKVIRMSSAGTETAPTVITSTNRVALDLEWEQSLENYANRQYISYGPSGAQIIDDYWTATTGQTTYTLHYDEVQSAPIAYEGGVGYPVGIWGSTDGLLWQYDAATTTLYRSSSGIANGTAVRLTVQVPFPQITYAETTAHASNPYETVNVLSALTDGTDYGAAQALAAAYLTAVSSGTTKRVRFTTRTAGFRVGQLVTITLADRHLSGTHLITSVVGTHDPETQNDIRYTVECVSGDYTQGSFLDTYRQWSGNAGSGAGVAVGAGVTSTASVSALHAHLGGSRTEYLVSTAQTPVVNYQVFTAPLTGTYTFRTERAAETTGVTAAVRLYDLTADAEVAGSLTTASASTSWVAAALTVSLEAGHQYRAELTGSSTALGVQCGQATVEL